MNCTGKNRLLKLAEFLETGEIPGTFYMGDWSEGARGGNLHCGSAACAFGWATTIPSFRRAGLGLAKGIPRLFGCVAGEQSGMTFFNIDSSEFVALFIPPDKDKLTGKRGRKIVAKRIRTFVEVSA